MDPLSVTAGVVGLLSASAQLIQGLNQLGSAVRDAAADTEAAATELASITIVVQGLQTYVMGRVRASPQRLQLISVEHITAVLTGCIQTTSDLDATLKSLHVDTGLRKWDKAKWFLKKDHVTSLTQRLQGHKATFTMMLNILQSDSMSEAESTMDRLCDKVNELLRSNEDLSLRLRNIESHHGTTSGSSIDTTAQDSNDGNVAEQAEPDIPVPRDTVTALSEIGAVDEDDRPRRSAFEEILHRTRVYRHVESNSDSYEPSLVSDSRSTLALSICSSLTLGDISNISVYALPIYSVELSNSSCYQIAEIPTDAQSDSSSASRTKPQVASVKQSPRSVKTWWKTKVSQRPRRSADSLDETKGREAAPIFGIPLTSSIRYANVAISLLNDEGQSYIYGYIPIIIAKCGVFLKEKATEVEYIFEVGASPKRLQELQVVFDNPPRYGKGFDWVGYDVHDVANILLRWLIGLPEPAIPFSFCARFQEALESHRARSLLAEDLEDQSVFDHEAVIDAYQRLITKLPPLHRQLLLYLLDFLAVFASKSELNKMTTTKLAALFQPGILAHPDQVFLYERRLSQDVVTFLVENQDSFLIGMSGTAA